MSRPNPTIYSSKGRVCFLNVSKSHWVTVSNIGFKPGIVNVFDSIPNNPISSHTKDKIAAIVFSDKEEIQLQFKSLCTCNMEMLTVKCLLLPLQQLMLKKRPYSAESPSQEVLTKKHNYRVSSSTKKEKSKR